MWLTRPYQHVPTLHRSPQASVTAYVRGRQLPTRVTVTRHQTLSSRCHPFVRQADTDPLVIPPSDALQPSCREYQRDSPKRRKQSSPQLRLLVINHRSRMNPTTYSITDQVSWVWVESRDQIPKWGRLKCWLYHCAIPKTVLVVGATTCRRRLLPIKYYNYNSFSQTIWAWNRNECSQCTSADYRY